MQQKKKPAAAEELAVPAKANPLETFGSLFGSAKPRPPSPRWPMPPPSSSWLSQRSNAARPLAKKPTCSRHKVRCPYGSRLLFVGGSPKPKATVTPKASVAVNPTAEAQGRGWSRTRWSFLISFLSSTSYFSFCGTAARSSRPSRRSLRTAPHPRPPSS